VCVINVIFDFL